MLARAYRAAKASEFLSARTVWKGMGRRRFCSLAVRPSHIVVHVLILATLINTVNSECKVRKCSEDYSESIDNNISAAEQCAALRAYKECADKAARGCRGDLNFHSIVTLTSDLMKDNNCSHVSPPDEHTSHPRPPKAGDDHCTSHAINGRRGPYKHCGLFGDPHLRTFNDVFETCKVAGAWPLIDNTYLAVQVTNVPLVEGSSATATDKLTVIIKDHSECTEQKLYQAQTGNLPAAFVDGTTRSGRSLLIKEIVAGEHVEILAKYISTRIVVRQVGRYLTFAIRMPSDLVNTSKKDGLELCVKGCPTREKIDFMDVIPSPNEIRDNSGIVMTKETAIAKCNEANVTEFYFDSCVFDLITTGDVNFTMAARKALTDFKELLPNASIQQTRTTSPWTKNRTVTVVYSRAPPRTTLTWTYLVYILLVHCIISLIANWRTNFVALLI
ncbi:repulsive guidance molecule A-like [Glandiceps talaboti]